MKEEKIREKYPNIETEEEFQKLRKMLRCRSYVKAVMLCAVVLLASGMALFRLNQMISLIFLVVAIIVGIISFVCREKCIDDYFLAIASRKKEGSRNVLKAGTIQKKLKKYTAGEILGDLFLSEIFGLLCMVAVGFIATSLGKGKGKVYESVFFVIIPLAAFGALRIGAIIKKRKTKNAPYILLHTKVANLGSCSSLDPESTSEDYYFMFNCAGYGTLNYQVSKNSHHSAFVGVDEYYLVIVKRRFSPKYKIVCIFSTEEYELSPELEKIVKVI